MAAPITTIIQKLLIARKYGNADNYVKFVNVISFSSKALKTKYGNCRKSNLSRRDPFNNLVETLPELPRRNLTPQRVKIISTAHNKYRGKQQNVDYRKNNQSDMLNKTEHQVDYDKVKPGKPYPIRQNDENSTNSILPGTHIHIDKPAYFTRKMLSLNKGNETATAATENGSRNLVLQGTKTIVYAMEAGLQPFELYIAEKRRAKFEQVLHNYTDLLKKTTIYWLHENYLKTWYNDETSISAYFRMADIKTDNMEQEDRHPVTLVLDKIENEEVVGKLLHFANENKFENAYVLKNCNDPWSNSSILHGQGAHFTMPISSRLFWQDVLNSLPQDRTMVAVGTNHKYESRLLCDQVTLEETIESAKRDEWFGDEVDTRPEDDEFSDIEEPKKEKTPIDYKKAKLHVETLENVDFTREHCVIVISGRTGLTTTTRRHVYDSYGIAVESPDNCLNRERFLIQIFQKASSQFQKITDTID